MCLTHPISHRTLELVDLDTHADLIAIRQQLVLLLINQVSLNQVESHTVFEPVGTHDLDERFTVALPRFSDILLDIRPCHLAVYGAGTTPIIPCALDLVVTDDVKRSVTVTRLDLKR